MPCANLTVTDQSPFYLEKAKENMVYGGGLRISRPIGMATTALLRA
jgi:hypothetical protein